MAKDPAFLFYSSDFLTGTMIMSDQEVGQYIRLLCLQHQCGHFDAVAMQRLCGGTPTALVLAKFLRDENGLFFNERLEQEILKRREHGEKQRINANKRWHKSGIAVAMPLENEIVNENISEKEKRVVGRKTKNAVEIPQDAIEVIAYLNTLSGKNFNATRLQSAKFVISRLSEGYTVEDLKKIIECKVKKWGADEKMRDYLRPETLFAATKIESYLQDANAIQKPTNGKPIRDKF